MPRLGVTRAWLLDRISEAIRVSRKLFGTTDLATYWARITTDVGDTADDIRGLRSRIDQAQAKLESLEEDLDAKS